MGEYYEYYDIPNDVKLDKLFRNLNVNEILDLCATSKDFSKICEEQETWIYLLWRDFRIIYDSDMDLTAKDYYIYYYNTYKGKLTRYIKNINEKNFFNILEYIDKLFKSLLFIFELFSSIFDISLNDILLSNSPSTYNLSIYSSILKKFFSFIFFMYLVNFPLYVL